MIDTNKRICFLNISADEVIRSLFYNKNNDSLITVSVYASDNFSSLKCRTTPIEQVFFLMHTLAQLLVCQLRRYFGNAKGMETCDEEGIYLLQFNNGLQHLQMSSLILVLAIKTCQYVFSLWIDNLDNIICKI